MSSDRYFREQDIKELLKTHVCTVNWDGTQLLYMDENDRWADMFNALPAHTREEITDEV